MTRLIDADALLDEYTYLLNSSLIDTEMSLFDLITNAPTVQREGWVSVEDRLPETTCYVDVWIKSTGNQGYGARRCSVLFIPTKHKNFMTEFESELLYISHWMIPPAAPKE